MISHSANLDCEWGINTGIDFRVLEGGGPIPLAIWVDDLLVLSFCIAYVANVRTRRFRTYVPPRRESCYANMRINCEHPKLMFARRRSNRAEGAFTGTAAVPGT